MESKETSFNYIQRHTKPELKAIKLIYNELSPLRIKKLFGVMAAILFVILMLPWTQNITSDGRVTTMSQESRPQEVNNIIPGRIVKWYVKEGDIVNKGDTILQLAEIKDEYLDPNLLARTKDIITAENQTIESYNSKNDAIKNQLQAIASEREAKLISLENKRIQTLRKVNSDSLKWIAAKNELVIAKRQVEGGQEMLDKGVIALTEMEKRRANLQNTEAKVTNAINDYKNTIQELTIINLEKMSTNQMYADKLAKAQGDLFTSQSMVAQGQGKVTKLENQYSNYNIRSGMYHIIAPQTGQISKIKYAGINEIIKEGEMIAQIVPEKLDIVAEMFVSPLNVQLINQGQKVMLLFDGFPAIVFRGWPNQSYGIFTGKVSFVENNIQENGKYRVFITPDESTKKWPEKLKLGSGVNCFALLNDVPVWYELWRQLNGFPPDFYTTETKTSSK